MENSLFESIKHINEEGGEYWKARELQNILEYKRWDKFLKVIEVSKVSCKKSGNDVLNHFSQVDKMVNIGSKAKRNINDYILSRYACYLIAQNADARKEVVALAQTYFAVQTRRQELNEIEYEKLSEDEKRLYNRELTKRANYSLNKTAAHAGVKNFDKFHNFGYRGLYGGETADDIFKRKGLRYREDILDNMGSDELASNLFRITQTDDKLINDKIEGERKAIDVHYKVGKKVRKAIKEIGGTMPENLPTPNKSIKEIEKEKLKEINNND